ncbi:methyl-accepting chemotaxis protein [Polyangium sp. 15x6]|uniref:methyl-accepting chemotaxis protein n=1 Tax=Polyangium sp. 15x6 TaxID=3042687 RepID=UPI00249C54C0|nr:methyl-accepting chemotaxis protein [Polyangium sp. 15x6]MDI3283268.1 methyl-accepting chemotaxis protein [Polyangium sp. 15x6]
MNSRQLGPPAVVLVAAVLFGIGTKSFLKDFTSELFYLIGLCAAVAMFVASASQGANVKLGGLVDALKAAARGKKPALPEGVTGELADVYEEIQRLSKKTAELNEEVAKLEQNAGTSSVNVDEVIEALGRAASGERVRAPAGAKPDMARIYAELSGVAEVVRDATKDADKKVQFAEERANAAEQRAGSAEQRLQSLEARISGAESRAIAAEQGLAAAEQRVQTAEQREVQRRSELTETLANVEADVIDAVQRVAEGERVRPPPGAKPEVARIFMELASIGDRLTQAEQREQKRRAELAEAMQILEGEIVNAVQRAGEGERVRAPVGAKPEVARIYMELASIGERLAGSEQREQKRRAELGEALGVIDEYLPRLGDGLGTVLSSAEQATAHARDINASLSTFSQSIEMLATSAEESSSSILEMTATSDEVAENVGELAASVRETVSSIEEMAYSIREVAKNVDGLSLTAEETSSSMNQMDVSIDQVQSNANETARLSEEVAMDAEKGAEAILKTISEIYRIKESSQEAVSVISNLGFRIEAIGQILAVIDDVAEQTNLLALNAAILSAQAGEHGKGFAVVADEIKELADRAGGSTKEIADLIKTIQAESKNAIAAVERGAHNVDRGVEVSNEAERALKKILDSSQKSTNMVRAIARATVEQAKGSKQVTDAIGRIAETVQQIAAATAEQARGSELIMKSAEKMRTITQHVERSSQEQARGGRQMTSSIEQISAMVNNLNASQRNQNRGFEQLLDASKKIEEAARIQEQTMRQLGNAVERVRRSIGA